MDSYRERLSVLGPSVIWLEVATALAAFRRIRPCFDESRYGLSKTAFPEGVERLDVDVPAAEARAWLEARIGRGPELILVAYRSDEVCEVPARLFLDHWQSHFCPADEEIAVLPPHGGWILCYFHEDQFEFARGGPAESVVAADRTRE